ALERALVLVPGAIHAERPHVVHLVFEATAHLIPDFGAKHLLVAEVPRRDGGAALRSDHPVARERQRRNQRPRQRQTEHTCRKLAHSFSSVMFRCSTAETATAWAAAKGLDE